MSDLNFSGMLSKPGSVNEIEFSDNKVLKDLCGELDNNLIRLENLLKIQINRRGNKVNISGNSKSKEIAVKVLKTLYYKVSEGRVLEVADFDAEVQMELNQKLSEKIEETQDPNLLNKLEKSLIFKTKKKSISPRTSNQKLYGRELFSKDIVFGIGPAGTGKTYFAVAAAVSMFLNGMVDRIILTRPAVEAGERLGFLPGDLKDKIDPYMQPLYDALNDFLPASQVVKMIENKTIEILPLAFMRGRTLSNSFIVLDEAQNSTTTQMKMFLTRLGDGSRAVVTGDPTQKDLPYGVNSGLDEAINVLKNIAEIGFVCFSSNDVVRHPLVGKIIEAYESENKRN